MSDADEEREAAGTIQNLLGPVDPSMFEQAQRLSNELAEATDRLNTSLRCMEMALIGKKFGFGRVLIDRDRDAMVSVIFNGDRLIYERWERGRTQPFTSNLLNASREVRILAARKLDALIADLQATEALDR